MLSFLCLGVKKTLKNKHRNNGKGKGNLVEHERHIGVGDEIVCTAHGMPALTNEAKVVILKTAVTPTA